MLPAVFPILARDSEVTGFIGSTPARVYRHGEAPQNVVRPYVTWFVVTGAPQNQLDDPPDIDNYSVQVDCWSDDDSEVEELATAVRDAIETEFHMTAVIANGRDPQTMRYRIGMIFSFWTHR
jgi:hypothetical protein